MSTRSLPYTTWYEATKHWTDVGDCNEESPASESLGVFATSVEAHDACRKAGLKILDEKSSRDDSGGRVTPIIVVFTTKSRTRGIVLKNNPIELTAAIVGRRQQILKRAERAGIPASAINVAAVERAVIRTSTDQRPWGR